MKPVAAGFDEHGVNEDVERLLAASSFAAGASAGQSLRFFRAAIAPHIAAARKAGASNCRPSPPR
jgi:dethiobiotin synthetase